MDINRRGTLAQKVKETLWRRLSSLSKREVSLFNVGNITSLVSIFGRLKSAGFLIIQLDKLIKGPRYVKTSYMYSLFCVYTSKSVFLRVNFLSFPCRGNISSPLQLIIIHLTAADPLIFFLFHCLFPVL